MIPLTSTITQHQTIGGTGDSSFDDAKEIGGWPNELAINPINPISKIVVRSGWIIDNLTITYRNQAGDTLGESVHGGEGGSANTINLSSSQILVGVSGKAGVHPYYNRPYLIQVSFDVYDVSTQATTTYGPYGDGQHTGAGTAFYVPIPLAFAGDTYVEGQTGIAGLCMIRKV